jgi:hypothetical protein
LHRHGRQAVAQWRRAHIKHKNHRFWPRQPPLLIREKHRKARHRRHS